MTVSRPPAMGEPRRQTGPGEVARFTDHYFLRTKDIVAQHGDARVTYAVFMRRPVISAPRFALDFLAKAAAERGVAFEIDLIYAEGAMVGAGEPIMTITGSLVQLVDLETLYLQRLGAACVAAYNAYAMCIELPKTAFLAMDARHCAGADMAEMMAYAASVGSAAARREGDVTGFIGNANTDTAHFFGRETGLGTMPHALIGYAGSTLRAAEMYRQTFPDEPVTVLVDYFGQEITDSLAVCRHFADFAASGGLSFRLDTHGGRYCEGLDPARSYAVLDRHARTAIHGYRTEDELRFLIGTGVSAAAIWWLRESLDKAGFPAVRIVASSGFSPAKCRMMAAARAPIDVVGTGSFLPELWTETYATADIIAYDGVPRVKLGREFLLRGRGEGS